VLRIPQARLQPEGRENAVVKLAPDSALRTTPAASPRDRRT
jgi:hypothetical protein